MKSKGIVLFFISLFLLFNVSSQVKVTGIVTDADKREPLLGATIIEKGTSNGVIANIDGAFTITVANNATLVVSFIGFVNQELVADPTQTMRIQLIPRDKELDEVVIIGYGSQKKSDITGSISSISGEDISSMPVVSSVQAMQGKAAGVQIIQNTGAPGAATTIKIRGTGTINDSDPLYVVDGFIVDNIEHINPGDIKNMEVLKDAASSSIYGSRGANGVVIITTKRGEKGKPRISFDSYAGFSNPWREIEVMGLDDFLLLRDYAEEKTFYSADGKLFYSKNNSGELFFDNNKLNRADSIRQRSPESWWDAITQTGIKQQYNLSVSGGNENNRYMISTNYYNEKGIVQTSDYSRFTFRTNLTNNITDWLTLQTGMQYTDDERNIIPEGQDNVLKLSLYQNPRILTYDPKGYFSENHPIARITRNHNTANNKRIDINGDLTARISKMVTYQFKVSNYSNFFTRKQFNEVWKLEEDFSMPNDVTEIQKFNTVVNKWEINNLFTFSMQHKKHEISSVVGQVLEGFKINDERLVRKGTPGNDDYNWFLSAGYTGDRAREDANHWTAMGFLGRLNYSYYDKYLLQVNFRADASSKFSENNRWGYFPSLSVGWKFSEESFLKNLDWVSLGKLRLGWGQLGNNRIPANARFTLIENQYYYSYGPGNHVLYPGATSTTLGNPEIRWEKTESTNIGLDLNFMQNRLTTSIELFDKLTTDMLLRVPVVLSAGLVDDPMINAGSIRNKGIEFTANFKGGRKIKYDIGFNISYIKNEVVSLGAVNEPVWGARLTEASILDFVTKTEVGLPIGAFYGYVTDGIFQSIEEIQTSPQRNSELNPNNYTTLPGDFRFKDLNGDGRITADDRTYLGSPHPDFVFGAPLSFSYGRFDLNIFFQGQTGNKVFNVMDYYLNSAHGTGNVYADIRSKHWSGSYRSARSFFPANPNGNVPDLDVVDKPLNFRASNFYIKDGSYLRLKTVQLNYNLPVAWCQKLYVNNLSVYIGGFNLLTLTKYNGFDPEIGKNPGSEGNNLYMGVDHGNYPQARTITAGVKIGL